MAAGSLGAHACTRSAALIRMPSAAVVVETPRVPRTAPLTLQEPTAAIKQLDAPYSPPVIPEPPRQRRKKNTQDQSSSPAAAPKVCASL
jgi:hypothetical protein